MPISETNAIVTDGLWRKSLSAVRSLGKSGFRVSVMGDSAFTTSFWSRFANSRILAPTAARDAEGFGQALLLALRSRPGAVILPMEDASLMWVSAHREEVAKNGRFLLPSAEALAVAQDKGRTLALAGKLGLAAPRTWEPSSAEEFEKITGSLQAGQFVVKPRSGTGSAGVAYGMLPSGRAWTEHWETHGPMLIQERVPAEGRGRGVSLLMDASGECVAAFVHERLQQYPNSGGPSTDRQSVHAPELIEKSIQLLKALDWRGIAMVEWKIDPRDGVSKLMEINPRFWGSLELAVRSGVDFPSLYARAALGEPITPVLSYPAGVRCRWMIPGEILRYLTQKKEAREPLRRFLASWRLCEEWDAQDLPGALGTLVCTAALALNPRYWRYVLRG